jgi:hypothetical protein
MAEKRRRKTGRIRTSLNTAACRIIREAFDDVDGVPVCTDPLRLVPLRCRSRGH